MRYKFTQLAVDITTFVLSGFAALCAYYLSIKEWHWWHFVATGFALAIMIVLTKEFITHFTSDTKSIREHSKAE
jgi:cell division protein FtsW (lipid II flippase)